MIKIKLDGVGNHLWQWDVNRRLVIEGPSAGTDIHFSNTSFCDSNALITEVYEEDGQMYAPIPNILLQQEGKLYIYPYLEDDESKYTMTRCQISVTGRAKPDDYIYTETEIKNFDAITNKLNRIETAVLYGVAQDLTETEKLQAQTNIGIDILTDEEVISLLAEEDMLPAVTDSDGSILSDESGNILLW